jgi:probable HAF family extracellular repeat protein
MASMQSAISALTIVSVVLIAGKPSASQQQPARAYEVIELSGPNVPDARGNSITASGVVAGYASPEGTLHRRAMVWLRGKPFNLGTLGGTNSNVTWPGQSTSGVVAGIAQTAKRQTRLDGWSCQGFFGLSPDAAKYTCIAFVRDQAGMHRLPLRGGDNSFAASMNNHGQVVGWAETASPDSTCVHETDRGFVAVLWDLGSGRMIDLLPYDDDKASAATTINDRGQVAGISGDCDQSVGRHTARHAVLWEHGVPQLLRSDATSWNTPASMTQLGDIIAGFSNTPGADPVSPTLRAVLWTTRDDLCPKVPGTNMCVIAPLEGHTSAQAWGVNQFGQVVGTSCAGPVCRAFLWENGKTLDLGQLTTDYQNPLINAMDINVRGEITGRARRPDGTHVAVVLVPR